MWRACTLAACVATAAAAGMNTHTMTGHLAAKYYGSVHRSPNASRYNDAIQSNPQSVEAGADFPDFLYACGSYADHHDAGEAAHWPPWQAAAIKYIRSQPDFDAPEWSDKTKKLIAFVFGVSVHYMTDELWEGLNGQLATGQGFVRMLSTMNLAHDGRSDNDESVANLATDFYVSWALDESEIKPWSREFPVKDIANIYREYTEFKDVTELSLYECELLFDLGAWAEKTFGWLLYLIYAEVISNVPYVAERVVDVPITGVDDMAVWSGWVWERVARWMDDGPPANPAPRAAAATDGSTADPDGLWTHDFFAAMAPFKDEIPLLKSLVNPSQWFTLVDPTNPLKGIKYTGPPGHTKDVLMKVLDSLIVMCFRPPFTLTLADVPVVDGTAMPAAAEAKTPTTTASSATPSATHSGDRPVGYYGHAVATGDFDGDGVADVATSAYGVGVPGRPQVGVVTVTAGGNATAAPTTTTLPGPMEHARFGWSLATIDFNADGVDDLAVGAPEASWNDSLPINDAEPRMRLWGRVYVYLGAKGAGLNTDAPIALVTATDFTGLGTALATGDVNADGTPDLLLGCPLYSTGSIVRPGRVFAVLATPQRAAGATIDVDTQADLTLDGETEYESFGQSLAVASDGQTAYLLVGAPGYRRDPATTVGKVYGYVLAADGSVAKPAAFAVVGRDTLGEMGHAVAASGDGVVALAAPAGGSGLSLRSGTVTLLRLADLAGGATAPLATISGTSLFGRFGYLTKFADVDGDGTEDLIVGAPLSNSAVLLTGREEGSLYLWTTRPSGAVKAGTAQWSTVGTRQHGRLGFAAAVPTARTLVVGSPRASAAGLEMNGVVDTFHL